MKQLLIFLVALTAPATVLAQTVVVVPASYAKTEGGKAIAEPSKKAEEKIIAAVEESGMKAISGDAVVEAIEKVAGPGNKCTSKECLTKLAEELGADEAIAVEIVDDDMASFRVSIHTAKREGRDDDKTDGYFVVLEWLRGTVVSMLSKPGAEKQAEEAAEPDLTPAESESTEPAEASGLSPTPFIVSASITGALLVGWGVIEGVGYSRINKIDDGGQTQSYVDSTENLQVANRVIIGVSAAALITTGVLFFLTDFGKETPSAEQGPKVSVTPWIVKDAAGLGVGGRF